MSNQHTQLWLCTVLFTTFHTIGCGAEKNNDLPIADAAVRLDTDSGSRNTAADAFIDAIIDTTVNAKTELTHDAATDSDSYEVVSS